VDKPLAGQIGKSFDVISHHFVAEQGDQISFLFNQNVPQCMLVKITTKPAILE
jgi:hypothetical protein